MYSILPAHVTAFGFIHVPHRVRKPRHSLVFFVKNASFPPSAFRLFIFGCSSLLCRHAIYTIATPTKVRFLLTCPSHHLMCPSPNLRCLSLSRRSTKFQDPKDPKDRTKLNERTPPTPRTQTHIDKMPTKDEEAMEVRVLFCVRVDTKPRFDRAGRPTGRAAHTQPTNPGRAPPSVPPSLGIDGLFHTTRQLPLAHPSHPPKPLLGTEHPTRRPTRPLTRPGHTRTRLRSRSQHRHRRRTLA